MLTLRVDMVYNKRMSKHDKNLRYRFSKDISWQQYFGEVYIIKETKGLIYTLKDEMVVFWNSMQAVENFVDLVNLVMKQLDDYDKKSIDESLCEFLDQLQNFGIIEVE